MPGPIPSTITPHGSPTLNKLGSAAAVTSKIFQHIDVPSELSLGDMMTWLTKRMSDSDADIRSKMAGINARKVQQEGLNELIEKLRNSKKNPDTGDGGLALESPLDNPQQIRESDFYKSLDTSARDTLDAFLNSIAPPAFQVTADEVEIKNGSETITWKKDAVISAEDAAKYGITEGSSIRTLPTRLHKDRFDDAIQNLGDLGKDLGSRDEMEMIKLQSAISARGQLLQMVSNMIASFNSTADKIVGNVR